MRKNPNQLDTDVALKRYIIIGFMIAALIALYFVLNTNSNKEEIEKNINIETKKNQV